MNLLRAGTLMCVILSALTASGGQSYLVTDRFVGSIHRIEDVNGDGDALDVGERSMWGTGLSNAAELSQYQSGVLVLDSVAALAYNFRDLNHDGDALDASEAVLWADGLVNPFGIDVTSDGIAYLSDFATHRVYRAQDFNGDGDALDVNEKLLYADNIQGAVSILAGASEQFVVAFNTGQVHALKDLNEDGDALDVGENLPHTPNSIVQVEGIAPREDGGYYAGSWSNDAIYRVLDRNADGDAFDVGEVLTYADNFLGTFNNPWGIAAVPGGDLLVANSAAANVIALRDKNHDDDAFDIGETVVYAEGIAAPVDIVALPVEFGGDYNNDGVVDAADYVVWRKGAGVAPTEENYNLWRTSFGRSFGGTGGASAANAAQVPESATVSLLLLAATTVLVNRRFYV